MLKFLISTLFTAILLPFYLFWGRIRSEAQIDKMQAAAFNSPGVEAPVPPAVMAAGLGVLGSHLAMGRALGLRGWQSLLSLLLGSTIGIFIFLRIH